MKQTGFFDVEEALSQRFITKSRISSPCPGISRNRILESRSSAHVSRMSLPTRNH